MYNLTPRKRMVPIRYVYSSNITYVNIFQVRQKSYTYFSLAVLLRKKIML